MARPGLEPGTPRFSVVVADVANYALYQGNRPVADRVHPAQK
jgi:hypothetical protein